jgi:fibronectin type III domain protein
MQGMAVFRRGLALLVLSLLAPLIPASPAHADPGMCRVVNVDFTPGGLPAGMRSTPPGTPAVASPEIDPQIVAWLEKPTGEYVQTIFITQQTGRFGMGNRPGRFDFNSGPNWPYGRRITVFPVWAHRHGIVFPQVEYQHADDNDLSQPVDVSSREVHFCRPLEKAEPGWDAATCASAIFTDKGAFGAGTSGYPPRSDVTRAAGIDSPSVDLYKTMNPFDTVSQATPHLGSAAQISWPIPVNLPMGDYVLFMEVSLEQDFNATYSAAAYPSPAGIPYGNFGVPYRGQPSVVYRVPFTISDVETIATTDAYVGYGDPAGAGTLHPPDATITTDTPNSGASRLLLTSKDGQMFRVRVDARPEPDTIAPALPGAMAVTDAAPSGVVLRLLAPGDDGFIGTVQGYEVRYLVGETPITDANFDSANQAMFDGPIVAAGAQQQLTIKNLLPETQYTVAVRAFDDCHNTSPIATTTFTTAPRKIGEVDACFIATAAYGSVLANDVEMLRHFRDTLLKHSVLGELAVETYYTFSPPVAGVVGESDLLRAAARGILTPVVSWVRGLRR